MGATVFPAPSVQTDRNWVQLSSVTTTAVATIIFTSLTAYKYYKILSNKLVSSNGTNVTMTLNNDSTSTYSYLHLFNNTSILTTGSATGTTGIIIGIAGQGSASNGYSGVVTINSDLTKEITYTAYGNNSRFGGSANWFDASQISRIDLTVTGDTFGTSGTIKVFGSN